MALFFTAASSDAVNFGSSAGLDDIAANDGTFLLWVYPDAVPPAAATTFVRKDSGNFVFTANLTSLVFNIARATQSLSISTVFANLSTYGAGKWCCVAAAWDTAGANGDQQLFHGDLATPIAEVSAYSSTQRVGSGAVTDTSSLNLIVGNNVAGTLPFAGRIAFVAVWNRRLSLDELIAQQYRPHVTSDCVLFTHLGYNGGGVGVTHPDWSGNGNVGTATGTTVADHVPLFFRRYGQLYVPYAAVGGTTFTITPAGVLVPVGALSKAASVFYVGSQTPTGATVRDTSKNVEGSAGSAGAMIRGAQSTLNGFLQPVGAFVKDISTTLTGSLDPSGSIARLVDKAVGGSVALAGSISHAIAVTLSGLLTPIGTLAKDVSVFFSGALTPSGTLATLRAVLVTFAGSIGLSGAITRLTDKGAGGALTPSGGLGMDIAAVLRGAITPIGSLGKLTSKFWSGVVGLAGTLAQIVGLVSPPTVIEITGSYIPALGLTGSYQPALSITGNYQPALTITGQYDT